MPSQRPTRLAEIIKADVSEIIQRQLKDPRVGFVSVTDVEVAQDLSSARIFVSVLGDETARKDTMKALDSATGYIRTELGKRLTIRHTPTLSFSHDNSIERGVRIAKILNEIRTDEAARPHESDRGTEE